MGRPLKVLLVGATGDLGRIRALLAPAAWSLEVRAVATLAALDAVAGEPWDLVLTEERVGDGDAAAVLARVRRSDAAVPVLVVPRVDAAQPRLPPPVVESIAERSERELRAVIENLPIGIVVRHGHTVALVNGAVARSFGVDDTAALIGRNVLDLAHPGYRDTFAERIAITDRGERQPPFDFRFERADGRAGTMEVSSAQHLHYGGRPAVMVTWRDVTEERALRDRVLMADRMAAVGTLASGVAHEINNPLACVTANLELLREELTPSAPSATTTRMPPDEILAALDDAREGAERVRLIVRDLRLFARGDAGERGPVDLGGVLQAAERMAGNLIKARARVVQEHAPLPPVDGNATRLCQVFVNILVNAAQAIADGAPDDNEVRVKAALAGDRVVVEVRDTGVGIPAEVRRHIFDPFFSTRGIGGGHGLGLSVCHGIVTSLGGEISITDPPHGPGTVVRVALPVYAR